MTATQGPRGGILWLVCCAWLALGCLLGLLPTAAAIDWQPALARSEPWRWWSAAFVHWTPWHLLANLAGLAGVAALGRLAGVPAVLALAWVASWPFTHLALLIEPGLAHFGGLSGVLHGGVAVAASYAALRLRGQPRWIGWAVLLGLGAKILLEAPWGPPLQPARGFGNLFSVAPLAHATGAVAGLVCALIALARGPVEPLPEDAAPES